jgi:hypothetical protein
MIMDDSRTVLDYAQDLLYCVSKYPSCWMRLSVWQGHFTDDENGNIQRIFFDELLNSGFKRTPWQVVFPGQTAGLIKKIAPSPKEDEYHIRFYDDGTIAGELEVNRFNCLHCVGPRRDGIDLLENILDKEMMHLPPDQKDAIRPLFGVKPYSDECVRK